MKILIYSDVHGNLPAFEMMLEREPSCEAYICLGDLVNYGPWSNECVDLALSLNNSEIIMGNHEEAYIAGFYRGEHPLVRAFFDKTYDSFARIDQIKDFVSFVQLAEFTCTHTINESYIYPDSAIELDGNYIIGHSHHQFKKEKAGFVLYNAGSVGQNRGYIDVVNYLIYDTDTGEVEMKEFVYDLDLLVNQMKKEKYPEECIAYYLGKKRRGIG